MSNFGNIAKAFNAQLVKLQIGAGNELITLTNISKRSDYPRTTIQTRTGVSYFYADAIREVTCEAIVSQDVYNELTTLNTRDAFGNLPQQAYVVLGKSLSGVSTDDVEADFNAQLPTLEDVAGPEGAYLVRFTLVIQNSSYVPSKSPPG